MVTLDLSPPGSDDGRTGPGSAGRDGKRLRNRSRSEMLSLEILLHHSELESDGRIGLAVSLILRRVRGKEGVQQRFHSGKERALTEVATSNEIEDELFPL